MMLNAFSGYKWENHDIVKDAVDLQLKSIDWQGLIRKASVISGKRCSISPQYTTGGRNIVRILDFEDGTRWIARLRLNYGTEEDNLLLREVACLKLIRERTDVDVPVTYAYGTSEEFGAPYMLMDCLSGNAAIDLSQSIPQNYKQQFIRQAARDQVCT